jgi:hypothetical protein
MQSLESLYYVAKSCKQAPLVVAKAAKETKS